MGNNTRLPRNSLSGEDSQETYPRDQGEFELSLQPQLLIEVGKSYRELEPDAPFDKVIAIFESDSFLVCTKERGGGKGIPYYFIREDVRQVIEYE